MTYTPRAGRRFPTPRLAEIFSRGAATSRTPRSRLRDLASGVKWRSTQVLPKFGAWCQVGPNEVCPAGRVFALWCGGHPVAFKNITDAPVGNLMAEIGQGTDNSIISPARILSRHLYN